VITPQQAPTPRAAWQASASGRSTACVTAQLKSGGTIQRASPIMTIVAMVESELPKRFLLAHATAPVVRTGAARGSIGVKVAAIVQRSLMAERLLYQFMNAEIDSESVRYTAMMMAMHSTARPVWFSAVVAIETTSG
jgi:hypothetical protein